MLNSWIGASWIILNSLKGLSILELKQTLWKLGDLSKMVSFFLSFQFWYLWKHNPAPICAFPSTVLWLFLIFLLYVFISIFDYLPPNNCFFEHFFFFFYIFITKLFTVDVLSFIVYYKFCDTRMFIAVPRIIPYSYRMFKLLMKHKISYFALIIPPANIVWGVYRNRPVCQCLPVHLSWPTFTSFVRFPPNFMEFKIMMCELCSLKDVIVHWVLPLLCLFGF